MIILPASIITRAEMEKSGPLCLDGLPKVTHLISVESLDESWSCLISQPES